MQEGESKGPQECLGHNQELEVASRDQGKTVWQPDEKQGINI